MKNVLHVKECQKCLDITTRKLTLELHTLVFNISRGVKIPS